MGRRPGANANRSNKRKHPTKVIHNSISSRGGQINNKRKFGKEWDEPEEEEDSEIPSEVGESDGSVSSGTDEDDADEPEAPQINPARPIPRVQSTGRIMRQMTREESDLLDRIRNNGGIISSTPLSAAFAGTSSSSNAVSMPASNSANSSITMSSSSSQSHVSSRLSFDNTITTSTSTRVRGVGSKKLSRGKASLGGTTSNPYFCLNVEADRLILSDLGVNRDIMESIDLKPRFSGASIRGALKPWYVNIDGSLYTVSEELEALVKVSYSIQAINLESPNLLPEVSMEMP